MEEKSVFAGIEPGGIADKHQVRVLICYLIMSVELPLTGEQIYEIFAKDDLVNYFAFMEAFSDLVEVQDILLVPEDMENEALLPGSLDAHYCCSPHGEQTARTLALTIPLSVRDQVIENAEELLEKVRPKYTSDVTITPKDNQYQLSFDMYRDDVSVLHLDFTLRSKRDAEIAERNLTENPFLYTNQIIDLLIGG